MSPAFVGVPIFLASLILAQGSPELTLGNGLLVYGPMGLVLAWFMLRGEAVVKEIRGLGHRIDGLTKALLVDVLSREHAGSKTREAAREMLDKIEDREKARTRTRDGDR